MAKISKINDEKIKIEGPAEDLRKQLLVQQEHVVTEIKLQEYKD